MQLRAILKICGIHGDSTRDENLLLEIEKRKQRGGPDATRVTWLTDTDPDNPQNWPRRKKLGVSAILLLYTFAGYIGSSLYTSSEDGITKYFNVSPTAAAVGFSLYVLGYGLGSLLWTPLSEIPAIGRTLPYQLSFIVFVVLCVPTALIKNFAGLLALRFLLGLFASPCLATAGASMADMWSPQALPYAIALWGGGATLAPALGPVVGNFVAQARGWRWPFWELLWLSGPTCVLMLIFLPETSHGTILLRRARRIRKQTGRQDLRSASENKQAGMRVSRIAYDALIKPWQINALDPAVLFSTFYTALTYGIYYSFFEAFPLVYQGIYGFNQGQLGLAFLPVLVGLIAATVAYCLYFRYIFTPALASFKDEDVPPEFRIRPGLFASVLIPIGLFLFAWTSRASVHWIVSMIGISISMSGVFIITQCMFIYLPYTYPAYTGSLLAANGFVRSLLGAGSILFAPPWFSAVGIGPGVSLFAGLSGGCTVGIWVLYLYGAKLRQRSRFAVA